MFKSFKCLNQKNGNVPLCEEQIVGTKRQTNKEYKIIKIKSYQTLDRFVMKSKRTKKKKNQLKIKIQWIGLS